MAFNNIRIYTQLLYVQLYINLEMRQHEQLAAGYEESISDTKPLNRTYKIHHPPLSASVPDRATWILIKHKKHETHCVKLFQASPSGLRKNMSYAVEVWVCRCQSPEPLYRAKTKSCSVPAQQWRQHWDSLYLFYRAISQLSRATPMQRLKKKDHIRAKMIEELNKSFQTCYLGSAQWGVKKVHLEGWNNLFSLWAIWWWNSNLSKSRRSF